MPRRSRELILAASRAAEAKRVVAGQQLLVETLKASGKPSLEAEDVLRTYVSALEVLEGHRRKILDERGAKAREAREKINRSEAPNPPASTAPRWPSTDQDSRLDAVAGHSTPDHWEFGVS